jgi:hypothetical protein
VTLRVRRSIVMPAKEERLKPEAAYFVADGGERTAFIIFDMTDPSQLPATVSRFFSELNARLESLQGWTGTTWSEACRNPAAGTRPTRTRLDRARFWHLRRTGGPESRPEVSSRANPCSGRPLLGMRCQPVSIEK